MRPLPLLPLALLLTACGTKLQVEGLSVDLEGVDFAYVERQSYDVDLDDDGTIDQTVTGIGAVLSDRDDLCGIEREDLSDVVFLEFLALYVGDPETIKGNTTSGKVLTNPEDGDAFVGARLLQLSGGTPQTHVLSRNIMDPDSIENQNELFITSQSINNGALRSLGGSFKAVLTADLTDEGVFDVDFNNDGSDDFRSTSVDIKGRIASAEVCANLDVLP